MKPRHTALLIALIALPVTAGGDRSQTTLDHPSQPGPAFSAGQILVLDPAGPRGGMPQAAEIEAVLGDALSTSTEGLVIEKSKVPGGGEMVNLQGRFQNAMIITVDDDGNISAPCVGEVPKTGGEVK